MPERCLRRSFEETGLLLVQSLLRLTSADPSVLFHDQVYSYYKGKGIYCIILSRALNLMFALPLISISAELQG